MSVQAGIAAAVKSFRTFQYILCVGSSWSEAEVGDKVLSFNTSYVSVQVKKEIA